MEPKQTIRVDFRRSFPLFPLAETVLLPHGLLPLHVSEARYRRMVHDVLDGDGLIAMALFDGELPDVEASHGRPPLRPFACVGYCIDHERLADGRYFVLLQGVSRTRIVEEGSHEPYRMARLSPLEAHPLPDEQLTVERERLRSLLASPSLSGVEAVERARTVLDEPIPTAGRIDAAIMALSADPEQRYQMLRQADAHARAAWLEQWLLELRAEREGGQAF